MTLAPGAIGSMLDGEHNIDQRDDRACGQVEATGQDHDGLTDRGERRASRRHSIGSERRNR